MGYYTNFSLEISPDTADNRAAIDNALMEVKSSYIETPEIMADLLEGNIDSWKWYDHDEEMLKLSKLVPEVLFTLTGEGEEGGDLWRSYYQNGKTYTYKMSTDFPDFDERKMK